MKLRPAAALFAPLLLITSLLPAGAENFEYRVLATSKTSTMQKEMNEAGDAGFEFASVMGGDTAVGGKEVLVVMRKASNAPAAQKRIFKLLATSKTSTMQKEMQLLGDEGFQYKGQTVFSSTFGGREVVVIMELDPGSAARAIQYRLLASKRTSTMQKELLEAGAEGFQLVGMTIAETAIAGAEMVCILAK